jgi:hypothetical protein
MHKYTTPPPAFHPAGNLHRAKSETNPFPDKLGAVREPEGYEIPLTYLLSDFSTLIYVLTQWVNDFTGDRWVRLKNHVEL